MISAMRFLRGVVSQIPGVQLTDLGNVGSMPADEGYSSTNAEPVLEAAVPIEGGSLHTVNVGSGGGGGGSTESRFEAFLDGTQKVRIAGYCADGVPIIWASTAAAIRVRANRRMTTWGHKPPLVHQGLYVPLRYCPGFPTRGADGLDIVDSAETDAQGKFPTRHPAALVACALDKVKKMRERLELQMAEEWCTRRDAPLFVDGSIQGNANVAVSPLAVGVIKSHRTLYTDNDNLARIFTLRKGERTSALRISPRSRNSVATWYLRLRDNAGRDPMFGLVRIEVAETLDITERANTVSQWVMAEGAPLALPDGRWDKMMYGVRDCEEYLRAIS